MHLNIERSGFTGLAAFGEKARAATASLPLHARILAADLSDPAEALHEAIQRRSRGHQFGALIVLPKTRVEFANDIAARLLLDGIHYDECRRQLESFVKSDSSASGIDSNLAVKHATALSVLRDVLRAADFQVVRSWREGSMLDGIFGEPHPFVGRFVARTTISEKPRAGKSQAILIWAPELAARDCALIIFALQELRAPIIVVSADSGASLSLTGLRATFISRKDVVSIEGVAAVVVAEDSDPAPAIALAEWNIPIAVSTTSGAHEYIMGAHAFVPWDFHSVRTAVMTAIGGLQPRLRGPVPDIQALTLEMDQANVRSIVDPPLVSVVIPTKDRRGVLPRALESVRRQTYSNIELIVINDGGVNVLDLLKDRGNEKYVSNPVSVGFESLLSQCISAASGKYFCALADDDIFFPDYIEQLVYSLERTGGFMARSMTATRILDKQDGEYVILGYTIYTPPAIDSTVMQYQNINGASPLYLTEMLRLDAEPRTRAGHLADHESYIRYMERCDFICVRTVGACIDVRRDGTNYSAPSHGLEGRTRLAADYAALYSAYPRPERPELESIRTKMVESVLKHAAPPLPAVTLSGTVPADYKSL
jgi:hypothetical protein